MCSRTLAGVSGICRRCCVPYTRAWCIGERHEALQNLIGSYKFTNAKAGYRALADLLDTGLPQLPSSVVVVPIPTIPSHVRQRGYDHTRLITREFAKRRGLSSQSLLERTTHTKQRGATRAVRLKQAKRAFVCNRELDADAIYLVVDDVVTTGATIRYAAKTLRDAGASTVWVASLSRQTLD
ncbi:MAG: hypothetical protein WAS27_02090 [Candidatus Saccharimonadales bacterium]